MGTEPQKGQLSSETKHWEGSGPPTKHSGPLPESCGIVPLHPLCFLKVSHCSSLDLNLDVPRT